MKPKTPQGQIRVVLLSILVVTVLTGLVIGRTGGPELADGSESAPVTLGGVVSPGEVYNPVGAGEELPSGFRQLLPRDAIRPVYESTFVSADEIDWPQAALVIGLELEGEARAYPVGFLNRREMVIDSVAGIPVLVTW